MAQTSCFLARSQVQRRTSKSRVDVLHKSLVGNLSTESQSLLPPTGIYTFCNNSTVLSLVKGSTLSLFISPDTDALVVTC